MSPYRTNTYKQEKVNKTMRVPTLFYVLLCAFCIFAGGFSCEHLNPNYNGSSAASAWFAFMILAGFFANKAKLSQ